MSLPHAILAILTQKEATGYDLAQNFSQSIGHFWQASHQQIYRELSKMEAQGWVSFAVVPQKGKPDKKRYALTLAGQDELKNWLEEPARVTPIRETLLIKLFAGTLTSPEVLVSQLETHLELHREKLAAYQSLENEYFQGELSFAAGLQYWSLKRGLSYELASLEWCEQVLAWLNKHASKAD